MILTEQQLFDYIECPLKYYLKNKMGITVEEPVNDKMLLNHVTNYFYNMVANGKLPSLKQMQSKLDSICSKHQDYVTSKKSVELWSKVYAFYNWACDNKVAVIDTGMRYSLTLDKHVINGVMNPVANTNNNFEILIMNFSSRLPDQIEQDTKLKHTLDILAFNSIYESDGYEISGTRIHSVKLNKDLFTVRNSLDFKRLTKTINNVAFSIENDVYYPRETYMCKNCNYKNYCRSWN